MFGYVTANMKELTDAEQQRYNSIYCGICRTLRTDCSSAARLGLSYDMAFLALLLMSLYEPEEQHGKRACKLHPIRPHAWVDSPCIAYAADMNMALGYYKALDDITDDNSIAAKVMAAVYRKQMPHLQAKYPRQCTAIEQCITRLRQLEQENCDNPDTVAGCFGALMGEILVYQEDMWATTLRQMGDALGRFIYLTDAAVDYRRDKRQRKYNVFLSMDTGEDWARWEQYLLLSMGRCTGYFEKLPLVQDKLLLDKILYSGVWAGFRQAQRQEKAGAGGFI